MAKGQFYILKEKGFSNTDQINSIFLNNPVNSKSILEKILRLNRIKKVKKLNSLKKLTIPSPLRQKYCNYGRSQSGLVLVKKVITSEAQRKVFFKKKLKPCNYYKVNHNYISKKEETPLSSILYSIFLTPVWKKNGLINTVKKLNGIETNKELQTRTHLFIPPVAMAKGCNYYRTPNGKVRPLKLILSSKDKKEFATAFKCAQALPLAQASPPKEEEKKLEPVKDVPPKINKPHHFEIQAVTNSKYAKSNVSDVEVDIISAYGLTLNYYYELTSKNRVNLNTQFEYYTEVINRELSNNFTWKKNLNFEYLYTNSKSLGFTSGLFEQWYFDNIEIDIFNFTSSVLPYLGLTFHKTFKGTIHMNHEIGYYSSTDLLSRERIKSGFFSHNNIKFPLFGYNISIGANIDLTTFERSTTRNISLVGGLYYNF
jgi:hypothetical protein